MIVKNNYKILWTFFFNKKNTEGWIYKNDACKLYSVYSGEPLRSFNGFDQLFLQLLIAFVGREIKSIEAKITIQINKKFIDRLRYFSIPTMYELSENYQGYPISRW